MGNEVTVTEDNPPAAIQETNFLDVICRVASDPATDVDKVERFLEMQYREMERQAAQHFAADLAECQANMPAIHAAESNDHTRSRYANLEAINKQIIPVYTKHGFSLSFGTEPSTKENHIVITCTVRHKFGHSVPYHYEMPYDLTGPSGNVNKTAVHASGSAISYGRRYLTNMIFNLTISAEDDDGNAAGNYVAEPTVTAGTILEIIEAAKKADRTPEQCLLFVNVACETEYEALEEISETHAQRLLNRLNRMANNEQATEPAA